MNGLDKFVLSTISMGFLILLITAPAKRECFTVHSSKTLPF